MVGSLKESIMYGSQSLTSFAIQECPSSTSKSTIVESKSFEQTPPRDKLNLPLGKHAQAPTTANAFDEGMKKLDGPPLHFLNNNEGAIFKDKESSEQPQVLAIVATFFKGCASIVVLIIILYV